MGMGRYLARQAARMALLLVCVSIVAFGLVSVSPIDPLQANVGQAALASMSPEQVDKLEAYWGVDTPPVERYLAWAGDVVRGDLGVSLLYRRSVASVIAEKAAASLLLMASAWVLSGLIGFGLGILSAVRQGGIADKLVRTYCIVIASTPTMWLALLLLVVFAVQLGWLPVGLSVPIGVEAAAVTVADRLRHAVLPVLTLSITGISGIALHTREKAIDILHSDYVLFARARGESTGSIVRRHCLRGALLPAMTLQFASISEIFGGSVLVEQIFSYPGLGQAAVTAGLGSDVPLLLAITLISAAVVFLGNFIANLLYGWIDPRIRKGAAER